jgi:predicted AAA+ superfamily ATPase
MIQGLVNARKTQDAVTELLTFILMILITTFVLRFLWNRSLVKHVSVLKKLDTFLDAFMLSLAIAVVRGI